MKTVSAAEANRHFSKILRDVAAGEIVEVTSHGRAVAKISPITNDKEKLRKEAAKQLLLKELADQPRWTAPKWTRNELYEDEPYPESFK